MSEFHLSPTRIACYQKCPALYAFRHLSDVPEPLNPWFIRGTAVHAAVEAFYRSKMAGVKKPLDIEGAAKEAVRAFDAELSRFPRKERDHWSNLGALRLDAKTMTRTYIREMGYRISPVGVEVEVERPLPSGIRIVGRVDLIAPGEIRDLKTASRPPEGCEALESVQLPAYAWLTGAELPVMGYLDFCTCSGVYPVSIEVTPARVGAFVRDAESVARGILAGAFPAKPRTPGACLRCEFATTCKTTEAKSAPCI